MVGDPVVVVGGGTAGCMVTSYLANNTNLSIVLVEPGGVSGHDDNPRFFDVLADTDMVTVVNGVQQARVLGGGSAVNGMLLTGDEPAFAKGLTRMATESDVGMLGEFLLSHGGRFSRLWWNGGRWNPGRAVQHLAEEKRITILRDDVTSIIYSGGRCVAVATSHSEIKAAAVVLCAGAMMTPRILMQSRMMPFGEVIPQNHFSVNLVARLSTPSDARFDTAVVKELTTSSGAMFMVNAYERLSANMPSHGLVSVSHMNPSNGVCDVSTMREASEILRELADSLRTTDGVEHVIVGDEVVPLAHVAATCAHVSDEDGRVRGFDGVWIADASVLRRLPTCTPAAHVTMEALRIAQVIAGELS